MTVSQYLFNTSMSEIETGRLPLISLCCGTQEQDKSSDIEQQPSFDDRKISNIQPQNRGGGLQNQQEHHIILTKYEAVHPTVVSENNSSSGMLII